MLPENERGAKGTFYTPPAEISFICRRAISNYLGYPDEVSADGKTFIDGISKYIDRLTKDKSDKEVREFRDRLLSLRVLDPAVGSGGFLLVMMQEIVRIIQEAEATVGWKPDPEELKERILPNLYGFDIEPEAIEIARLRLWLSLIIDQKEPEPLPNLDMSLIVIKDSLVKHEPKKFIDSRIEELREDFAETRAKYLNEHDSKTKKKLKGQLQETAEKIAQKTGTDPNVIEAYMPQKAHLIVMNPPYVRQEALPQKKKDYYVNTYSISKKSDLFGYFLIRTLSLLTDDGVASVISSDKWLETDYGVSLQEKLKENLIAVYGQRERSFGADINTVITVYSRRKIQAPLSFTYIESYGERNVKQHTSVRKNELAKEKWFYLRAPAVFMKSIFPKLTANLEKFGEMKRGYTTGANDFFYMFNISHLYEADYLANKEKFGKIGISTNSKDELDEKGLIYVENEEGNRFIIEKQSLKPLLRSIRSFSKPYIDKAPNSLCLVVHPFDKKLPFTSRYISWGEKKSILVTRGAKIKRVVGYQSLSTTQSRPVWYMLPELKPARIALPELYSERFLSFYCKTPCLADHLFDVIYPKETIIQPLWLYLNSTIYFIMLELWSPRMGGGALHPRTMEYKTIPTPDIEKMTANLSQIQYGERETLPYDEEIKQPDRIALDLAVLKGLGFESDCAERLRQELCQSYLELVKDRIIKAGKNQLDKSVIHESDLERELTQKEK